MATNQTYNVKDEVMSNIHQGILDVQHASDGTNTTASDKAGSEGNSAVQPEELPTKKPEVEPEKIPKENPGIQPDTEEGDDDDESGEPPLTQPGIVMGVK